MSTPQQARAAVSRPAFPQHGGQRGLATKRQLLAAGFTQSAIQHALTTRWSEVLPGVVAPHRGHLGSDDLLVAAALWAGSAALLTGSSALRIYGLTLRGGSRAAFLVPATRRRRQCASATCHPTDRLTDPSHWRGCVAVAPPGRALLDLARFEEVSPSDLQGVTIAALQRRVTTPELLTLELASSRRNHTAVVAGALADFRQGAWSRPEVALRQILEAVPGLPAVVYNRELEDAEDRYLGCPDAYVRSLGLAIQVHSRTFHTGTDEHGRDLYSETLVADSRMTSAGIVLLPVTPNTLERSPHLFIQPLRSAIETCRRRPVPDVRVREPRTAAETARRARPGSGFPVSRSVRPRAAWRDQPHV